MNSLVVHFCSAPLAQHPIALDTTTMTARSANCAGKRYLYGMRPEYQCSLDGSHRGARVTTSACPSTRRANIAVQIAKKRKLQGMVAIKQFDLKDREKELIGAPAGQVGAGLKPSRGGHGARHIIEEVFQTQTGVLSAPFVREGEEHSKGAGRGQLSALQEGRHGQQDGGVPKGPRWSRTAGPTGHGSGRADSTATFTHTNQSIASGWLVCFCDTD